MEVSRRKKSARKSSKKREVSSSSSRKEPQADLPMPALSLPEAQQADDSAIAATQQTDKPNANPRALTNTSSSCIDNNSQYFGREVHSVEEREKHGVVENELHGVEESETTFTYPVDQVQSCYAQIGRKGGSLRIDAYGIHLKIPRGAVGAGERADIILNVFTESPHLHAIEEGEINASVGFEVDTGGYQLKRCAIVSLPHCLGVSQLPWNSVGQLVLYTCERNKETGVIDPATLERKALPFSGRPSGALKPERLELTLDHFCGCHPMLLLQRACAAIPGWYSSKAYMKLKVRPFTQEVMPRNRQPTLRVCFYRDVDGLRERCQTEEREDGYVPLHREVDILLKPDDENLRVRVTLGEDPYDEEIIDFYDLTVKNQHCVEFKLDFHGMSRRYTNAASVVLTLQQGRFQDLHFYTRYKDTQYVQQAQTREREADRCRSNRSEDITDDHLEVLSRKFPTNKYPELCDKVNTSREEGSGILARVNDNYDEAVVYLLRQWKERTGGDRLDLKRVLQKLELGSLAHFLNS